MRMCRILYLILDLQGDATVPIRYLRTCNEIVKVILHQNHTYRAYL